ncbi:retrovirus-related pol polyprotein from transposon TNT 1-94 [Tanacetum coccineum]|uniref:Retrovirus-related pol polyprotein from transposon TNT 1-94 n=1 Tax=Tanacetum coccineum TaxID=301880 RepID=A0ABQ5GGM2_9ASTR
MFIETIHVDFDELTAMVSEQFSSGPGPKLLTSKTTSSGLVPIIPSLTPYVSPTKNDWEILFQPMFDEYLNPPPSVDLQVLVVIAPELAVSTGTPSLTIIDQDAPSTSTSQTSPETPSLVIPFGVEEADHDIEVSHMDNNPVVEFLIPEPSSEESSTRVVIPNHVHSINQPPKHINKWTKDHSIDNVIGDPSRPVSTRQQLQDKALLCYFNVFLSFVEPKSYKDALTESCWIEAMQEELNEFECLEVWELVLRPDYVMVITLKWIYKVKLDELGGVLKNKACLVARVYRQEEGVDFEESFAPLKKALYGLKQAPRAWYDLLSSFLLCQKFTKGIVDPTFFVRREGKDILLISQSPRGIFLNQSKYALDSLKKYGMETCKPADTPMVEKSKLDEDPQGKAIDPTHYRGMIGTLMYLTASRPDLVFTVCMCAWYQEKPTEKHLHAVKRIFQYLRGTINMGLWNPKDSCITLTAFADADHTGCQDTKKSMSRSMQLLGDRLVSWVVELYFVRTEYQLADIFTKPLARKRLEFLIKKLGMQSMSQETLKKLADEEDE